MNKQMMQCKPIILRVGHIKQKNICGCGLAAIEMVLKYYGATDTQTDFCKDKRINKQVESAKSGLSEGTLGVLALKRGYNAIIFSTNPRLTKTFLRLGGKVRKIKTDKDLIIECLAKRIPPIVLIPKVSEAYEFEREEIGHYVVVNGVDHRCKLNVKDPQYTHVPKQEYWDKWSSSLLEIKPANRLGV
jgi:ABC-type bacteriocin/lantibiotic exporter with double-glycine peptidase domain